jgi:hypothetical protein
VSRASHSRRCERSVDSPGTNRMIGGVTASVRTDRRSTPRPGSPRRAPPRPYTPRLRASPPDRRVLGKPQDADVRRAPHRLRGGSDAPGGARRDASGAQLVLSHLRHRRSCRGDGPGDGRGIGRVHLSGHFESCSCRNDDDRRLGHAARTYITVSATPGRAETRSNLAMSTWLGHAYQLSNKVHGRTCGQDVSLVRS